ncbi:hypothetical protein ACFY1L_41590 [Streptomyces sp. NPDC001663]|uniref:hypothetical protein n=1 Tax=Streptomyces sp. NPDC001663 TaxID=3364597 RepID=UPI0036C3FE78
MTAHSVSRCMGTALAFVLSAGLSAGLTGCSGDDSPSTTVSKVASAARSAASEATAATAAAGRQLDEIKGGIDAKGAVELGTPATDSGGRAAVEVTVHNTAGSAKSFAVQVDFTDASGNTLDAVVVTVSDVAAGKSGTGTARSNRKLSGEVKAEVARAVRY